MRASDPDLSGVTGSWTTGSGASIAGDPCGTGSPYLNAACVAGSPASWAWFAGTDGRVDVQVKSGYTTPDPAFDKPGSGDNSAQGGCDQLAVIITESESAGLGASATNGKDLVSSVRSVARVMPNSSTTSAPSFLLLERDQCNVLTTSGNPKVQVFGNGTAPGTLQADSLGDGCGYAGGKIISVSGSGAITVHRAESGGLPGLLTITALSGAPGAVPANASTGPPKVCAEQVDGSCGNASGHAVVGRGVVDQRYLAPVTAAMNSAKAEYNKTSSFGTTSAGVPYTVLTNCSNPSSSAAAIFLNCPTGLNLSGNTTVSFPNATDVVVNGSVTLGGNAALTMPKVARFYLKGGYGTGLSVSGALTLGDQGTGSCAAVTGGSPAVMVVGTGAFQDRDNGSVRLCNTTVLLADNTTGDCAAPATATVPGPFQATANGCKGNLNLSGNGVIDWTAPNQVAGSPGGQNTLEDLALWTETASGNVLGGTSSMSVSGVFFLPNAYPFVIYGNAAQSNGADAQFVARTVMLSGNGTLYVRPNPSDVVTTPGPPNYQLVR